MQDNEQTSSENKLLGSAAEVLIEFYRSHNMDRAFASSAVQSVIGRLRAAVTSLGGRRRKMELPPMLRNFLDSLSSKPPIATSDPHDIVLGVATDLNISEIRAEELIRAVFAAIGRRMGEAEQTALRRLLPDHIAELWAA